MKAFIEPGKPIQNAFVESFNGRMRDESLSANWLLNVATHDTRFWAWRHDYNQQRPHRRIYATGGGRHLRISKENADHYGEIATLPTAKRARASFFSRELHEPLLAVRAEGSKPAAIRDYAAQ